MAKQVDVFRKVLKHRVREPVPKALERGSDARLARAVVENMRVFRSRLARAGGGKVYSERGIDWMDTPKGETGVAITHLAQGEAGKLLARAFGFFARQRKETRVVVSAGDMSGPEDLMGRLIAWGVHPTFLPGMAADLEALHPDVQLPEGVALSVSEDGRIYRRYPHPLHGDDRSIVKARFALLKTKRVWHFLAQQGGEPLGQATLHLAGGVAGIYDVGVVPKARRQGIGTAVTLAACLFARKLGYRYAVLWASMEGEPVYQKLGFWQVCRVCYSDVSSKVLREAPPLRDLAIACAASAGERGRFCKLMRRYRGVFSWRSPTGMSPLGVAVASGRADFAGWMVDRGAELDAFSAYKLGWLDALGEMTPEVLNAPVGVHGSTVLHQAAYEGNIDVIRLLLKRGADATVRDAMFESTPQGWAKHFGQAKAVRVLAQAGRFKRRHNPKKTARRRKAST